MHFTQSWLPEAERNLRPGFVRIGWRGSFFCFDAHLVDDAIFTTASRRNDELYRLGDTLELFAGAVGEDAYVEYHFSPNDLVMQLFWPRSIRELNVRESGGIQTFMREENESRHVLCWTEKGWRVSGMLAASALGVQSDTLTSRNWEISFGRYDYSPLNSTPVISSTSRHEQASFHRRFEWTQVEFSTQM